MRCHFQVLSSFKKLHRTGQNVFEGDETALRAARVKINEEYKKNKDCSDAAKVEEMVKFAESVETELRCTVVQAVQTKENGAFGKMILFEIFRRPLMTLPLQRPTFGRTCSV